MEEKGSDVNFGAWMITDAFEDDCELTTLITNDSDLAEPMRIVRQGCGKSVGLINPHPRRASRALVAQKPIFVAAEEIGIDGASVRVHHFERQLASPFPLLSAIAARTSRIEIGTAVIDMRYENPN
jgi:hypothetical protein